MGGTRGVLVVGSINTDTVIRCPRIALPGETVVAGGLVRAPGGKGGNQAVAAARLGVAVHLVGRVGADPDGAEALALLAGEGVRTGWVLQDDAPTGLAVVLLDDGAENAITVVPGANAAVSAEQVSAAALALREEVGVVLASLEVPLAAITRAAAVARAYGWPFILNPAPAQPLPIGLLAGVDVLTPNEHELALLHPDGARGLLAAGVGAVVVTLGAEGTRVHRPGTAAVHRPACPVRAVDTTGAGDAFNGALAWALAEEQDLDTAVRLAAAAGALATRAVGARSALPTAAEVRDLAGGPLPR